MGAKQAARRADLSTTAERLGCGTDSEPPSRQFLPGGRRLSQRGLPAGRRAAERVGAQAVAVRPTDRRRLRLHRRPRLLDRLREQRRQEGVPQRLQPRHHQTRRARSVSVALPRPPPGRGAENCTSLCAGGTGNEICFYTGFIKLAFHDADTDTDFLGRILADSPDTPTSPRKSSRGVGEDVGVGVGFTDRVIAKGNAIASVRPFVCPSV